MVILEQTSDGRWWISKYGWGRPIGEDIYAAEQAAREYYPNDSILVKEYNE